MYKKAPPPDWWTESRPLYTEDNTKELTKMLLHFKEKHDISNRNLSESGESGRCKPFEYIMVKDIKDYILRLKGVSDEFIDL